MDLGQGLLCKAFGCPSGLKGIARPLWGYPVFMHRSKRLRNSRDRPAPGWSKAPRSNSRNLASSPGTCTPACSKPFNPPGRPKAGIELGQFVTRRPRLIGFLLGMVVVAAVVLVALAGQLSTLWKVGFRPRSCRSKPLGQNTSTSNHVSIRLEAVTVDEVLHRPPRGCVLFAQVFNQLKSGSKFLV